MTVCYITFGQRYRHEKHPCDDRAHPDGWFEYEADTYQGSLMAAQRHLTHADPSGHLIPHYACDYQDQPELSWYPRGCLARFTVATDGHLEDVT